MARLDDLREERRAIEQWLGVESDVHARAQLREYMQQVRKEIDQESEEIAKVSKRTADK